jgi:tRNA A37 threonylcarbamoyladenosine dehydratase
MININNCTGFYFDRLARLYGRDKLEKLRNAHVMLFGLGGVGSWAAEALARTAAGRITLVDFDIVGDTNMNRQMPALCDTIGEDKTAVVAERLRKINPEAEIIVKNIRLTPENTEALFKEACAVKNPDVVIDAIDNLTAKCFLINYCREHGIPVIVSCGSGGRTDPSEIKVMDLGETANDALARTVRGILRKKYNFPKKGKFGIKAVCSSEPFIRPFEGLKPDEKKNFLSEARSASAKYTSHEENGINITAADNRVEIENSTEGINKRKTPVLGTACFVTGTFGFFCASEAVKEILKNKPPSGRN